MPSKKNIDQVKNLKERLEKAKSVVLANYQGLEVNQINKLRQKVKKVGGELRVAKNTLLQRALKNTNYPISEIQFTGPSIILFSFEDELAPLKALYDFSQENELPKIKFGFLGKDLLKEDKVIELANLPSKEVLQGKLVGVLQSPIYGLVYVLKANLTKLVIMLAQIRSKQKS